MVTLRTDNKSCKPKGCCLDCSSTNCDERCIQAAARIECHLSCGLDGAGIIEKHEDKVGESHQSSTKHQDKTLDTCSKDCCGDTELELCSTDHENPAVHQEWSCCANEKQNCCNSSEPDVCNEKEQDCCGEKDSCCNDTENDSCSFIDQGCCSANINESSTEQNLDKCCSKTQNLSPGTEQTGACCMTEKASSPSVEKQCCLSVDSASTLTFRSKKEQDTQDGLAANACVSHLQKAFDEYASYIEKGKCICRDVLQKYGLPTRCDKASRKIVTKRSTNQKSSGVVGDRKSCCSTQSVRCDTIRKHPSSAKNYFCDKEQAILIECAELNDEADIENIVRDGAELQECKDIDIEAKAARCRVVLNVTGMTCSGCGRKMENVLKRIKGLTSFKVTFVSNMAEFDLDLHVSSAENVIQQIERETGFKCSPVVNNCQTLDLLLDDASARLLESDMLKEIENVEKIAKDTYRISYNATTLGARTLLSRIPNARLAPPSNDLAIADGKRQLATTTWATLLTAIFTVPILVLSWSDNQVPEKIRLAVSFGLATVVQFIAIREFYIPAIKSLVYSKVMETDMLVVISISAAYGYSLVAFALSLAGHVLEVKPFFETSTLLITLVLFGRLMAALARLKAVSSVSVRSLQVEQATLIHSSGEEEEIDARLLQMDDIFRVRPHAQIVTDGVIIDGHSAVNEAMVTGESMAVTKSSGDNVIAGTLNGSGMLSVQLTRLPGENSITDIASLIDNALSAKPHVQDLADKFASLFIPVVMCIALLVLLIWLVICFKIRHMQPGGAFGTAATYAIAVLAITCPCAIGLAVPMVLVIAGGVAARAGIIVKQANVLERAHRVTDVVFDKTGTLTLEKLDICYEALYPDESISAAEIRTIAKILTTNNEHPVSHAVNSAINGTTALSLHPHSIHSIPGCGVEGIWKGMTIKAGNPSWLGIEKEPSTRDLISQGMTLFCLSYGSKVLAVWGLRALIRPEASKVIENLSQSGVNCHIVSGDLASVVRDTASMLQIPLDNTAAHYSPADKHRYVERLMNEGKVVLFCGDGTNDAVAVARADVGVQIGNTSNVTRATADVVLLGTLEGIPSLLQLSRRVIHRIHFNFAWSVVYNVFAILLAAGAFVKFRIAPAYAGLGEIVSIAPVILAAMTLYWFRNSA